MRRFRNSIVLVLTAVVIVFCAILPQIPARIQDSLSDKRVVYEDIKTVQFYKDLTTVEKLFLVSRGSIISADEEKAKIKTENIREVVENALFPYIEAGLIPENLSDFSIQYEPLLYYDSTVSDISNIFWCIDMKLSESNEQKIYLCIDDQSEKIMMISYECLERICDEGMLEKLNTIFYNTYQDEMELWESTESYIIASEQKNTAIEDAAITFCLSDAVYGELNMTFCANTKGFYNYFD